MSGFQVGDEVCCVDAKVRRYEDYAGLLVEQRHYVISEVDIDAVQGVGVRVSGVEMSLPNDWFRPERFVPVRRESIELFKQMAKSKKPLVPIGAE